MQATHFNQIRTQERRENDRNRRIACKQKRAYLLSFYIKHSLNKYIFYIENPIKQSQNTNCFFIHHIERRIDGLVELTMEDCLDFVKFDDLHQTQHQSTEKERLDYRDPSLTMMINFLTYSLEYYDDWIFNWNIPKKNARHILYTSHLFRSININGKVITYKQAIEEGEEFYHNVISPIHNGKQPNKLKYKKFIFLADKQTRGTINISETNSTF